MSTIMEQMTELELKKAGLDPTNIFHQSEIEQLERRIEELKKQIAIEQERVAAQEEKITGITLPFDFNDVFGDPRANDIMIELIQQYQRDAYEEHNAEVSLLKAENRELKADVAELQFTLNSTLEDLANVVSDYNREATEHTETKRKLSDAEFRADDADSKRDAAVRELEEVKAELQQLKETKTAAKPVDVGTSDKLSALVQQSMAEKAKNKYDAFWERNKDLIPEVKPVGIPEVQPQAETFPAEDITPESGNGGFPAAEVPTLDFRPETNPEGAVYVPNAGDVSSGGEVAAATTEERISKLEARVTELESRVL